MRFLVTAIFSLTLSFNSFAEKCDIDRVEKTVNEACKLIKDKGAKDAYKEFSKEKFNVCGTYIWAHTNQEWKIEYHKNTAFIGKILLKMKDANPKADKKKAFPVLINNKTKKDSEMVWVEYMWPKPKKDKKGEMLPKSKWPIETKCTFVKNCNGEIAIGMGLYKKCKAINVKDHE